MDNVIHLKEIFNTPNVIESICNWNAARYEQEFNKSLALKLLNEEFQETLDAPNVIEILDGLGDTFYVAVGVLWKYGGSPELITELFDHIETSMPIPSLNVSIQWVNEECTYR